MLLCAWIARLVLPFVCKIDFLVLARFLRYEIESCGCILVRCG
jgi:hypothetical protein